MSLVHGGDRPGRCQSTVVRRERAGLVDDVDYVDYVDGVDEGPFGLNGWQAGTVRPGHGLPCRS